jgi:Heterokaryon incompatibility protein (HET)
MEGFSLLRKRIQKPSPDYDYAQLTSHRNEIRLLKLTPSLRSRDPISCSLEVVSLDDPSVPRYAALSYCWGDGPPNQTINCDGFNIRVTYDLLDVLRSLRRLTRKHLWVDQICINQTDLKERSSQVQLMRRIYSRAVKTFLHPGRSGGFSHLLLHYLKLVRGSAQLESSLKPFAKSNIYLAVMLSLPRLVLNRVKGIDPNNEFCTYAYLPCFSRAWILQEASLSAHVQVVCRNIAIRWDYFESIISSHLVDMKLDAGQVSAKTGSSFFAFSAIVRLVNMQMNNNLLMLLLLSNLMRASDPRDQIYALLGIASDAGEFPLPDYTISVVDVFRSFASIFVAKGYGSDILALASCSARNTGYPSWIPAWEQKLLPLRLEQTSNFSAGRVRRGEPLAGRFDVDLRGSILLTYGVMVDTILTIYSPDAGRVFDESASFDMLLQLVKSTAMALQHDDEPLKHEIFWPAMADLHLKLILCLVFDHDGDTSRTESPNEDTSDDDDIVTKVLLAPKAPTPGESPSRNADSDTLAEVLSEHLRRSYREHRNNFFVRYRSLARTGRFAITDAGRLCLVLTDVRPGDRICIIFGCRAPYVLRENGSGFLNIGETYIRGLMHGEALNHESNTFQDIPIH